MNSLFGMRIIVSPTICKKPKLAFSTKALGFTTPAIQTFNKWLEQEFGYVYPMFVLGDHTIFIHPKVKQELEQQLVEDSLYENYSREISRQAFDCNISYPSKFTRILNLFDEE